MFWHTDRKSRIKFNESMKDNYFHICIASEKEVIFRTDNDYRRAFNSLALAVYDTNSVLLADAIMSNHIHFCVQTTNPGELVRLFRNSYQRYFNAKYLRNGMLGDRGHTQVALPDPTHNIVAITYVLRNPLHHGVCTTPFEYKHSSVRVYFRKSLGNELPDIGHKVSLRQSNMPSNRQLPKGFSLDDEGQILRDSVIDVRHVENLFGTPQDFIIDMARYSTKKWRNSLANCLNDNNLISLESIESNRYLESVLEKNEHGKCAKTPYSDIFICNQIDNVLLPKIDLRSVYQMNIQQKLATGRMLHSRYHCSLSQLGRCLAATDDSFYRLFFTR